MGTLNEFKAFAVKGNVIDLAVGVIIGAAFAKIVDSLVGDVVMPVISTIIGGLDFSSYYIPLNHQSWGLPLAEARKAGAVLAYGSFLTIMINFLLLAFIIFQMVRLINRARLSYEAPAAAPVVDTPPPEEVLLLRQIRDAITSGQASPDSPAGLALDKGRLKSY